MKITAEDRLDMIEVMSRYNQALDVRDSDAWADSFTEDGIFDPGDGEEIRGRSALKARLEALGPATLERHWATDFIIETNAGEFTLLAEMGVLKGHAVVATGRYVNTMRQIDGRWKIARQSVTDASQSRGGP